MKRIFNLSADFANFNAHNLEMHASPMIKIVFVDTLICIVNSLSTYRNISRHCNALFTKFLIAKERTL